MTVKVDAKTMTLKVVDCDHFEGMVISSADNKTIELIIVDSSTPEDFERDKKLAEETNKKDKEKAVLTLYETSLSAWAEMMKAQGKPANLELNLGHLVDSQFKPL